LLTARLELLALPVQGVAAQVPPGLLLQALDAQPGRPVQKSWRKFARIETGFMPSSGNKLQAWESVRPIPIPAES
jgi:hypothetical protein